MIGIINCSIKYSLTIIFSIISLFALSVACVGLISHNQVNITFALQNNNTKTHYKRNRTEY